MRTALKGKKKIVNDVSPSQWTIDYFYANLTVKRKGASFCLGIYNEQIMLLNIVATCFRLN